MSLGFISRRELPAPPRHHRWLWAAAIVGVLIVGVACALAFTAKASARAVAQDVQAQNRKIIADRAAQQSTFAELARGAIAKIDAADRAVTAPEVAYKGAESSAYESVQRLSLSAVTSEQKEACTKLRHYLGSVTVAHAAARAGSDQLEKYWPLVGPARAAAVSAAHL